MDHQNEDSIKLPDTHRTKMQDGVVVVLVLLHILPVANGLLHLLGVDVFGPPAFQVVHPTGHRLVAPGVHLGKVQQF